MRTLSIFNSNSKFWDFICTLIFSMCHQVSKAVNQAEKKNKWNRELYLVLRPTPIIILDAWFDDLFDSFAVQERPSDSLTLVKRLEQAIRIDCSPRRLD